MSEGPNGAQVGLPLALLKRVIPSRNRVIRSVEDSPGANLSARRAKYGGCDVDNSQSPLERGVLVLRLGQSDQVGQISRFLFDHGLRDNKTP